MIQRVDIALLPAEAEQIAADAFVVVDVLRATTTIAAFFAAGATEIVATGTLDLARHEARTRRAILAGEVGGLPPECFDLGNSPRDALAAHCAGRPVVLFTTNGTKALAGANRDFETAVQYAGAIVNAAALAAWIAPRHRHVVVVCAGLVAGARFGLDDFVAAGAIADALARAAPAAVFGDAARLARATWLSGGPQTVREAEHAAVVRELGLGDDIEVALALDRWPVVPVVVEHGHSYVVLRDAATAGLVPSAGAAR